MNSLQICTFYLDDLYLGIEVTVVQEIVRFHKMTPVPLASPVISGLMNLRGQILTVIDLRKRFGLPAVSENKSSMNVIVNTDGKPVSLLVDEIGDVIIMNPDCFEKPPDTLTGPAKDFFLGAYMLSEKLLLLLDIDKVMQF